MVRKKINTVAKGLRKEGACEKVLKEQGYITWRKIRTKYHNPDIFRLFDVVGLHPEGDHILFIQTKSNRCDKPTKDAIAKLKMPAGCRKEIWIWKDRKYWEKLYF